MARRDYVRRPKIFIWDAILVLPLMALLLYPRLVTLLALLAVGTLLFILDRRGMAIPMTLRWLRTFLVGRRRYIRPPRRL
ncbi:hypothetical protein J2T57_001372 [Natronocella acetinitrilica]|uniref:Uncharacterized protein n=1 Tax=Natronocella acetinitrilica TaxID=414046 RepID=A0AAE3KAG5_9GAMM|nr:IcmT/TraK family protein [Natronocella acetinitrilica]MCP1674270.1 hypothetical protein [Natronocella acetinitrilica]